MDVMCCRVRQFFIPNHDITAKEKTKKKKVEYVFLECHIDDFLEFYNF